MIARASWPVAWFAGLLIGCSPPGVVKPHAPDMTRLVESYDSPSGVLDPDDTEELVATVAVFSEVLSRTQLDTRLRELLNDLVQPITPSESLQDDDDDDGGLRLNLRANGYLEATRICPGWA